MEEELEELRKKRAIKLRREYEKEAAEEVEKRKKLLMRQILTPKSRERLSALRLAKPQLVELVEAQLLQLVQAGKVSRINETMLKQVLSKLTKKREIKIRRK